ncbi:MAG: imidazoleglycerol-phosphate dehydratase HisB [Clostridiales bacterium]|nr:imidazoleglycerol-phosphate dehydratase HisB [Clostridiales bacterium]
MRKSEIIRKTRETDIKLNLNLQGGEYEISTGCGFLNHMLELFAVHSSFGLKVNCVGDTEVDFHHTVEDVGIALGQAYYAAIGDKRGIARYADIILPMDEALILCAVDVSGRGYLNFDVELPSAKVYDGEDEVKIKKVGAFDTELIEEFFIAFTREAKITLHFKKLYGKNTHHIIEGVFKAFARVLSSASKIVSDSLPSSKGVL